MTYIMSAFQKLMYPCGLQLKVRRRAESVNSRPFRELDEDHGPFQRLVLPSSSLVEMLQHFVGPQVQIAAYCGMNIGDLVTIPPFPSIPSIPPSPSILASLLLPFPASLEPLCITGVWGLDGTAM